MNGTVVVVGSINVDLVTTTERLPAPGETVTGGTFGHHHGGKGANQAVAIARLGGNVVLIGMVGDDEYGGAARAELERDGVALNEVRIGSEHTGVAQILVDATGENLIAVAPGANREITGEVISESFDRVDADNAVVLTVLEIPDDAVLAAATAARRRGWPFVLNPAPARDLAPELLAACDVVTPNEHEARLLGAGSAEGLLDAGAAAVVVTRGARGADLLRADRPPHHQAAFDVDVLDTTGCGDAFSGTLAWGLANRLSIEDALEVAAAAGALATRRVGARAGLPSRTEIDDLLAGTRGAKT